MRSIMLVAVIALGAAALASPAAAGAAKGCGTFTSGRAAVHAKVIHASADCTTARRVLRRYLSSTTPCSGSACVRYDRGWACATASATAFPRLATCNKRRAVVAAYSSGD